MRSEIEIRAESDEHYMAARKRKAKPYVAKKDADEGVFKMPFLGCYKPEGWEVLNKYFVDSSGFGQEGEPALTVKRFLSKVVKGRGYSLESAGQFQVNVNEFEREKKGGQ